MPLELAPGQIDCSEVTSCTLETTEHTEIGVTGSSPWIPSCKDCTTRVQDTLPIREAWIQSPSRSFKPFVSVRVGEIQTNTDPSQWRHIPGEVNVADDVSRGIRVEELNGRWSNGPEFLQLSEEFWPQETVKPVSEEDMERRQVKVVCEVQKVEQSINPKEFSI